MNISDERLAAIGNQLRIHSINATTAAGSGHATSSCSAADLMSVLFFAQMRYHPDNPKHWNNDRFILSKGHAAPLLYAAWAEAGYVPVEELTNLRKLSSDLEGHPTPRLPFVDVATGALGQGLSVGVGMALSARLDKLDYRTYVMLGDGECAEGSVWEAANLAGVRKLNNLVAVVDVNRLGQSEATAFGHDVEAYRARFEAFGWRVACVDGHNIGEIRDALASVGQGDKPLAVVAKTKKGAGISFAEDKDGWHGKALSKEDAEKALAELKPKAESAGDISIPRPNDLPEPKYKTSKDYPTIEYKQGDSLATRAAYGNAMERLGDYNTRIVALDGDVKNSTLAEKFAKKFPDRFTECYIAEQNMVGAAIGLGVHGKIPFASTFGAFFTRAHDQIRMGAISMSNVKMVGSHVGVSIGEDGGSQMAMEDIGMMRALPDSVVLYPCDAVSTEKLVEEMLETKGMAYLRTSRPKTPILYPNDAKFPIGGAKVLRQSESDKVTVVGAGVTLVEALKAADELAKENIKITVIDAYSIKPLAKDVILEAARKTHDSVVVVEDHYPEGGIGDTVAGELSPEGVRVHKMAVRELPRSGKTDELLAKYEIDAAAIIKKVKGLSL